MCRNEMGEDESKRDNAEMFSASGSGERKTYPGQHQLTSDGSQRRQPRLV